MSSEDDQFDHEWNEDEEDQQFEFEDIPSTYHEIREEQKMDFDRKLEKIMEDSKESDEDSTMRKIDNELRESKDFSGSIKIQRSESDIDMLSAKKMYG